MTLLELNKAFEAGSLSKAEFISKANEFHIALCCYPEVLERSEVDEIKIDSTGVAFHISASDLWLRCPPGEARVAPVEMLNFRAYEPEETQLMLSLLRDGQVVFDVGANIGWYSLLFARRFPASSIHAFEPLPYFNAFLMENVVSNGFQGRIDVHPMGFSNEQRSAEIFIEKGNATNASLRNVADSDAVSSVPVDVMEMDRWCAEHRVWPDFIKCDVEGAELLVMQGATEVLTQYRPVVVLEILRKWTKPYGYHPNDLIELLASLGYECFAIGSQGPVRLTEVTEATVETNYFFLNAETHATHYDKLKGLKP